MTSETPYLDFVIVDVFTQRKYEGNPLAIVTVPTSVTLTQEQKQAVAREFNLSETTFVHQQDGDNLSWRVDIFTTTTELPFAGHPTIGTAVNLLSKAAQSYSIKDGDIEAKFNIKAGPVGLRYDVQNNTAKAAIPHDFHIHKRKFSKNELLELQPQLARVTLKDGYPIVSVVKGMTFILIDLENIAALEQVATTSRSTSVSGLDEGWDKTFVGTYFYVRLDDGVDGTKAVRTRMIEGTLEDPATGSAASDLAGYLSLVDGKPNETLKYAIIQGVEMGRRSNISIEVQMAEDAKVAKLYLEGSAVLVMEGKLKA